MTQEFQVVSDELRVQTQLKGRKHLPEYDALLEGKTVFFPLNGLAADVLGKRIRSALAKRSKRATVREFALQDQSGLLAWVTGDTEKRPW